MQLSRFLSRSYRWPSLADASIYHHDTTIHISQVSCEHHHLAETSTFPPETNRKLLCFYPMNTSVKSLHNVAWTELKYSAFYISFTAGSSRRRRSCRVTGGGGSGWPPHRVLFTPNWSKHKKHTPYRKQVQNTPGTKAKTEFQSQEQNSTRTQHRSSWTGHRSSWTGHWSAAPERYVGSGTSLQCVYT